MAALILALVAGAGTATGHSLTAKHSWQPGSLGLAAHLALGRQMVGMQTWQGALCSACSAQQEGDRAPHLALWSPSTVHQSASGVVWGRGMPAP